MNKCTTWDLLSSEINFEERLTKIWKNCTEVSELYSPLYSKVEKENSILFMGLNPSVSNNPPRSNNPDHFIINFDLPYKKEDTHQHFKKFYDLKERIGGEYDFSYLDLLFWRATSQKDVERLINSAFVREQAKLTVEIVKKLKPRLVIVSNSFTDKLLHTLGIDIGFNPIIDMDIYHLEKIPFIIKESKYLGSRRMWYSRKDLKENLLAEIVRVLKVTEHDYFNK